MFKFQEFQPRTNMWWYVVVCGGTSISLDVMNHSIVHVINHQYSLNLSELKSIYQEMILSGGYWPSVTFDEISRTFL